jgi:hypothetical protein
MPQLLYLGGKILQSPLVRRLIGSETQCGCCEEKNLLSVLFIHTEHWLISAVTDCAILNCVLELKHDLVIVLYSAYLTVLCRDTFDMNVTVCVTSKHVRCWLELVSSKVRKRLR